MPLKWTLSLKNDFFFSGCLSEILGLVKDRYNVISFQFVGMAAQGWNPAFSLDYSLLYQFAERAHVYFKKYEGVEDYFNPVVLHQILPAGWTRNEIEQELFYKDVPEWNTEYVKAMADHFKSLTRELTYAEKKVAPILNEAVWHLELKEMRRALEDSIDREIERQTYGIDSEAQYQLSDAEISRALKRTGGNVAKAAAQFRS